MNALTKVRSAGGNVHADAQSLHRDTGPMSIRSFLACSPPWWPLLCAMALTGHSVARAQQDTPCPTNSVRAPASQGTLHQVTCIPTHLHNKTTSTETPLNRTQLNNPHPPQSWFWSHDILHKSVGDVMLPDMQLMRLAAYGEAPRRRFAAWAYRQGCDEPSSYIVDRSAPEMRNELARSMGQPVSITVEEIDGQARFSVVLQRCGVSPATFVTGMSEAALRQLMQDAQRQPRDLVTYRENGQRWYAALLEDATSPFQIFNGVGVEALQRQLKKTGMVLTRLRGYDEGGTRTFLAVARQMNVGSWAWYDNLTADKVAQALDKDNGYPVDLDVHWGVEQQPRYSLVLYRDR
jgi:hypothetical protein